MESGVLELSNPTTTRVDLSGWIIQIKGETTATASLPQGTMIDAGGYVVVSAGFPKYSISQGLILRDNHGDEIDSTPSLGWLGMTGFSWQRYPDGSDNWRSSPSTIDAVNMPELPSPLLAAATILLAWGFVLSRKIA